jgi:hypothetical protein
MDFLTEQVTLPRDQSVSVVCESEERGLFGQAKQTLTFALPPNAPIDVVRGMLADKLSTTSSCVHLQVLVRESSEYEPVTCGSVADVLAASNPAATTLTLLCMTESRYGCFYLCCAALCAACCATGYAVGKAQQKKKPHQPPPPKPHQTSQPYGNQLNMSAQYPQAIPATQYYHNTSAQPPQTYAYGSPVQYSPQSQQNAYQAAPPSGYIVTPQQYQSYGGNQVPAPL